MEIRRSATNIYFAINLSTLSFLERRMENVEKGCIIVVDAWREKVVTSGN